MRIVQESRRPAEFQYPAWHDRQMNAITRTLEVLEGETDAFTPAFTIDQISIATALEYLDLRLPEYTWRNDHPHLASWLSMTRSRKSLADTSPHL